MKVYLILQGNTPVIKDRVDELDDLSLPTEMISLTATTPVLVDRKGEAHKHLVARVLGMLDGTRNGCRHLIAYTDGRPKGMGEKEGLSSPYAERINLVPLEALTHYDRQRNPVHR